MIKKLIDLNQYTERDFFYFENEMMTSLTPYVRVELMGAWILLGPLLTVAVKISDNFERLDLFTIKIVCYYFLFFSIINLFFYFRDRKRFEVMDSLLGSISLMNMALSMYIMVFVALLYDLDLDSLLISRDLSELTSFLNNVLLGGIFVFVLTIFSGWYYYLKKIQIKQTRQGACHSKKFKKKIYIYQRVAVGFFSIISPTILITHAFNLSGRLWIPIMGFAAGAILSFRAPISFIIYFMKKKFPKTYIEL